MEMEDDWHTAACALASQGACTILLCNAADHFHVCVCVWTQHLLAPVAMNM